MENANEDNSTSKRKFLVRQCVHDSRLVGIYINEYKYP